MRLFVQIILISIIVGAIAYGEYFIFWKKSEYTAPQAGNVIDTYESSGKHSSTCFATVHFDAIKKHRFFNIADKYIPKTN